MFLQYLKKIRFVLLWSLLCAGIFFLIFVLGEHRPNDKQDQHQKNDHVQGQSVNMSHHNGAHLARISAILLLAKPSP